jgi:cytochrome o ubiquinol oxidase subunit 2
MHFKFHGLSQADFDAWVAHAKASGGDLTRAAYLSLEKPSEKVAVRQYAAVDPELFNAVVNRCVEPGKMCMSEMMALDAQGGTGKIAQLGLGSKARPDEPDAPARPFVQSQVCSIDDPQGQRGLPLWANNTTRQP